MNKLQYKLIKFSEPYLVHYNHNHDKLGRFARSNGISSAIKSSLRKSPSDLIFSGLLKATSKSDAKKRAGQYAESVAKNEGEMKALLNDKEYQDLHKQWLDAEHKRDKTKFDEIKKKIKNRSDAVLESERKKNQPFSKEELQELEEMERADKAMQKYGSSNLEWNLSPEEAKHVMTDNEYSTFEKNPKTKSVKNVMVETGYDFRTDHRDISVSGESTKWKYKEEKKSSNGVHIIDEHPTSVYLDNVEHDSGAGIDRRKLKTLDAFANSKEATNALYKGRDLVASTRKDTRSQDWSPMHITYGFDSKGKPTIKNATYFNGKLGWDDADMVDVDFDEKRKPGNPWHT